MYSTTHSDTTSLAVHTEGLGKRFGTRAALDGVDLEVPRGAAFGFLGWIAVSLAAGAWRTRTREI